MLHDTPCQHYQILHVDGVLVKFSLENEATKVSLHTFNIALDSHEVSWETMATSRTLGTSASKETSLLTSSPSFQRRTSSQLAT